MSVPNSMKVGPFVSTVLVKKRYLFFYFFLVWISTIAVCLEFWIYYRLLINWRPIHFWIFLPLLCFLMYVTSVLVSLIVSRILLSIVNIFHKPREGVFLRDPSDKDYRYWSLRNTIKKWPVWLAHKFPFPFLDNLCFKMFGVKTKFENSLFEGWVDTEFIEFGQNVVVGQASIVQSTAIIGNLLIIKKTIIEDNVRIGAHCVVMPGTHIGKNCILAANSVTLIEHELESGWIYLGIPATKYKENRFFEKGLEDILSKMEQSDANALKQKYDKMSELTIKYEEALSHRERKELKRIKLEEEKRRLERGG